MYTKKDMLDEIKRIKDEMAFVLDADVYMAVFRRQQELLEISKINVTASGTVRYYLTKNAKYNEIDDYLNQLINAMYDVCGFCF